MNDVAPDIGGRVRARRLELGLTLDALAAESGVSVTMLSEVERAVKNPTIRLAWQIARALGCSLTDLIEESGPPPVWVVSAADRPTLADPETGVVRHGLSTELLRRGLEVVWYRLPPGASTGEMSPNRAGVLEHVVGLAGELTLLLATSEHQVSRGDNVTYGPQTAVEYRNAGEGWCEFLLLSDTSQAHGKMR